MSDLSIFLNTKYIYERKCLRPIWLPLRTLLILYEIIDPQLAWSAVSGGLPLQRWKDVLVGFLRGWDLRQITVYPNQAAEVQRAGVTSGSLVSPLYSNSHTAVRMHSTVDGFEVWIYVHLCTWHACALLYRYAVDVRTFMYMYVQYKRDKNEVFLQMHPWHVHCKGPVAPVAQR